MIRGTTAKFKFKMPYPKEEFEWITIKFWQPGNTNVYLPIIKTAEQCDGPDGSTELYVSLTAEETSRFSDKYKARMQMRSQHSESGIIYGTRPRLVTVYPMDDEILDENPAMPSENEEGWIVLDGEAIVSR